MPDPVFFIALLVFSAFILVLALRYARQDRIRRSEERVAWGRARGLRALDPVDRYNGTWDKEVGRKLIEDYRFIPFFSTVGTLSRVLQDHRTTVFDYCRPDGESTTFYGVVSIVLQVKTPKFAIRSTRIQDRWAGWFGRKDIEIGATEFDRDFHLECDDEAFLRELLDFKTISMLGHRSDIAWYCQGSRLVAVMHGRLGELAYDRLLDGAQVFADRLDSLR